MFILKQNRTAKNNQTKQDYGKMLKQKQTEIWLSLCNTFMELFNGDIRKLFDILNNDVDKIRDFIQKDNKKKLSFPNNKHKFCENKIFRKKK